MLFRSAGTALPPICRCRASAKPVVARRLAEKLLEQKGLKPVVVPRPRREDHRAIEPLRLPVEIALVMAADHFDHFAHDGELDAAVVADLDLDEFAPGIARIAGPATEGKRRTARFDADDLEDATGADRQVALDPCQADFILGGFESRGGRGRELGRGPARKSLGRLPQRDGALRRVQLHLRATILQRA